LETEVSRWEPRAALDGGVDGLDFYRRIAEEAPDYLRQGGAVAVEIGATMGSLVLALFRNSAAYLDTQVHQDYSGRDRVIVARTGPGPELV
jgi:release factor glutamine methyltransferase